MLNTMLILKKENPKFKVGDHVRVSKYKRVFPKGCTPNWSEEVFAFSKVKNTVPWTYVISDRNGEKDIGTFCEKEQKKTNQEEFKIKKVIKKKETSYMLNGKTMTILLIVGLIKTKLYKMSQYFPKPHKVFGETVKVELDLFIHARKADLKK